jgi:hypothetical protein
MKSNVIKFFQNLPKEKHEQFNKAFELYRQSEGKSPVIERAVNASGFSEHGLENLLYDLQKLHGITDVEKVPVQSQMLKVESDEEGTNESKDKNTEVPAVTPELDKENKALVLEIEDLQDEKADLEEELEATNEENESLKDDLNKLKALPKIDARSIRVEFPFLSEPNCPDEFKILVADKITAWNEYLERHKTLLSIESGELVTDDASKAEIAKAAIASFDENQKIYDELVAYAESGKVLGVHPLFKKLQLTREVEEMTPEKLNNYKGSSAKYFTDNRKALAKAVKANNEDRIIEVNLRVAERETKLALVNKKLGINPK